MALDTAEVIGTDLAFSPSKNRLGQNLKLGAIKIRMGNPGGAPRIERFAYPLFNFQQVPLIGEHILVIMGPGDIKNPGSMAGVYYYLAPINLQGNRHLNPLPGAFDITKAGVTSGAMYAAKTGKNLIQKVMYKPGENFKEKKSIAALQPYEGDILIEGRHGQAIRIGSTLEGSTSQYQKQHFIRGDQGKPIIVLSNGHKEGSPSILDKTMGRLKSAFLGAPAPDYTLEKPDDTETIFIMTSKSHKVDMKLSKTNKKIGEGVKKLSSYIKPQLIGSSDRIILNSKKDEILLIAKTDVKVVTKGWNTDMESFFDQVLEFMNEVIDQNKELEKTLKELGKVAQANASSIHPTGVGPSGPPTNAASFIKSKTTATTEASKVKSIRTTLENIRDNVKKMKA